MTTGECTLLSTTSYTFTTFEITGGTIYIEYDDSVTTPYFTIDAQTVSISAGALITAKGMNLLLTQTQKKK